MAQDYTISTEEQEIIDQKEEIVILKRKIEELEDEINDLRYKLDNIEGDQPMAQVIPSAYIDFRRYLALRDKVGHDAAVKRHK